MLDKDISDNDLLDWICRQERLTIQRWHTMRGEEVCVWAEFDDPDDAPASRAGTTREALEMAMRAHG